MLKKTCLFSQILLVFFVPCILSDEPLCDQVANYTMNVTLDTGRNLIQGEEILSWTNTTESATEELWFHLYWNAFQNNKSTFLQEAEGRWVRLSDFRKDDWGYCHLNSIKIIPNAYFDPLDLTPTVRFRHPDDENVYDQTVFTVQLPKPVEPGQTILLHIDFHSRVPRAISRAGFWKDYYFVAQWFPKIGVFEEGRWNCHQYHAMSEYYADFGTYDVHITLPSSYIVGGTGEHQEKTQNSDGTTTHRFYQHSVHDFAWAASPRFLEGKENFEFAPGKTTEITLLLQPHHKNLKRRYMDAVKNAIKYCSLLFGDYPYSTATCVDPAYNSRSEGMEYPTFFTGEAYFISGKGIPNPESITIHEFGHGYFYGLVASNEFENPWMDEGFTSFLDTEVYYKAYGEPIYSRNYFGIPVTFKDVKIPIESDGISAHRQTAHMDIMQRFSWEFMGAPSYGANSYSKASLMLRTLKRFIGEELFLRMIKAYSQRHWFKHPRPDDFYDVVSEFAGQDMSWFMDQIIYGSGKLDYAVGSIRSRRIEEPVGWFDGTYRGRNPFSSSESLFQSEVVVQRLGEVRMPVEVLVIFEDGKRIQERWDGQYRWKKYTYRRPHRIKAVIVDPQFKLVLDVARTNNSMIRKPNRLAPLKWVSNWLSWLQQALELLTIFGG